MQISHVLSQNRCMLTVGIDAGRRSSLLDNDTGNHKSIKNEILGLLTAVLS